MSGSDPNSGERVRTVRCSETRLIVELVDGRTIEVPLDWFPRLSGATPSQRAHWEICGGGFGIHWPDVDEDLSVVGLLRGAKSPRGSAPSN